MGAPLLLIVVLSLRLRQSFDVDIELEASGLLNTKQEAHIERRTIRNRRRQRYNSSGHRRIEAAAIRL